ncbi:hypothetical protein ACF09Y_21110 [Streptomyces massasporeus]|uniref:hypothetical protein n=1 Tax=Streptomyces massasporeus TaxID=67324 RepID=UPI0036FAE517
MSATPHPTARRPLRSLLLALVAALLPLLTATALSTAAAAAGEPARAATRAGAVPAATLTEVTNFGTDPSNLRMYLYVLVDDVRVPQGLGRAEKVLVSRSAACEALTARSPGICE